MRRIAYYLRNSTDQQDYQYQLNNLNSYFETRRDVELIQVYGEKISGFKSENERPEMKLLLESVDKGEIDEIWVNDFTRLSRAALNLQTIVYHCADKNVNIFFKDQNLNTLDDRRELNSMLKLMISILSQFAEMDAKNFKSKGIQGKTSKAKLGNYVGGTLPCGYTYINDLINKTKRIVIDENQKKVVEYIFNAYGNEKKTLARICNELNTLKITDENFSTVMKLKNKGQNSEVWRYQTWNPTTLKRIIECTWYSEGYRIWAKERIELDESLKFIPIKLYEKANRQLSINKTTRTPKIHTYFINNKLYCSCGELMRPKRTGTTHSYVCNKVILGDYNKQIKCVTGKSCQTERLENSLWLLIKNNIPEFQSQVQQKTSKESRINSKIERNNQLIYTIENEVINGLKESRKRSVNVYTKLGGDYDEFAKTINDIDKEIKDQEKISSDLKFENENLTVSLQNLDLADELVQNIQRIESDKNLIKLYVHKLIKKVVVCGGISRKLINVYEITWNGEINNDNPTYLFYRSKSTVSPKFYFITVDKDKEYMEIKWNAETIMFRITNTVDNENIEIGIDGLIDKIDGMYDRSSIKSKMEFQINSFFRNTSMKNNNCWINLGVSDLNIVWKYK